MYECFGCYVQDAILPYIQRVVATCRNKANRSLAFLEPWEIAACAVCVTLIVVWILKFLFSHNESKCSAHAVKS